MGPACVPIFDDCQDDEVPMLGGGCKRVGGKECLNGWGLMGPPDWTCKPIGPPTKCLAGWDKVAGGWCEPILPKSLCPAGTMEKIGHAACQPVGDCGSSTWGNLKTTANTIYVDQGHRGAGSKGTQTEPYKTITEALGQATAGAHVVVAAGTYKEQVSIQRKVTLEGRCAQQVTIDGGQQSPAVYIKDWASGAVLRGMTITGAGGGLYVYNVTATAERVVVQGCGGRGVQVDLSDAFTLRDSLVNENRGLGFSAYSSIAALERVVVRGTRERASDNKSGKGIQASISSGQNRASQLVVRDSLVTGNRTAGVGVYSSTATLERTVVRDTNEQAADNQFGQGIIAAIATGQTRPAEVTVRDCLISRNRSAGVTLYSSRATLERTVVRSTRGLAIDNNYGNGVVAMPSSINGVPAELVIRESLVKDNRGMGVALYSSKAEVDRAVVQDTHEQLGDSAYGMGIQAEIMPGSKQPSALTVRRSVVAGSRSAGISIIGSTAFLEQTVVRDTRPRASDKSVDRGVHVQVNDGSDRISEVSFKDCLIRRNREIGLAVFSSTVVLERTIVQDTLPRASDNSGGRGVQVALKGDSDKIPDLTMRDCLIVDNYSAGLSLYSARGVVERTSVRGTQSKLSDGSQGVGVGVYIRENRTTPSQLSMRESVVTGNRNAGLLAIGSPVTLERCAFSHNAADRRGRFGDGIVSGNGAELKVDGCLVEGSDRAGLLFAKASGEVRRTLIRKNVFAIDLEHGASPRIRDDNLMTDNQSNKVSVGQGLALPPVPPAPSLN